jgi:hypothetical protein
MKGLVLIVGLKSLCETKSFWPLKNGIFESYLVISKSIVIETRSLQMKALFFFCLGFFTLLSVLYTNSAKSLLAFHII